MARNATIYRAHLELSLIDRDVYAERTLTLAQHPSETVERALVRLLAFALCYEPDLEFGRGVSATDEPDLWSREGDGRARHWIEVGQPEARRLVKSARHARRVTLFAFGEGLWRYREAQFASLDAPDNLAIVGLDGTFVADLAGAADRALRWSVTLSEGIVYLSTGETSLETTPEIWLGDPLRGRPC